MPERAGGERVRKDSMVSVRFTPEEAEMLRRIAPNMSKFIREAALTSARRPHLHNGRWCDDCWSGDHLACHTDDCRCGHMVVRLSA